MQHIYWLTHYVIIGKHNVQPAKCVFFFCWWNACCLPLTMLCSLPFTLLSYLIDCVSFSVLAVGDRCWVLLSVAVRVGSRGLVQHSSDSLIDTVLRGGRGGGQMPVLTSMKKNWGGKWILQWCACCGGIVILHIPFLFYVSIASFTEPHFLIYRVV